MLSRRRGVSLIAPIEHWFGSEVEELEIQLFYY